MKKLIARIKYLLNLTDPKDLDIHPVDGRHIEYVFSCGTHHYYKMVNDYEIYQDRWSFMAQFAKEMDMNLTKEVINAFMDAILKECKINNEKPEIDLGRIIQLVNEVKYRGEWLFEPDALYRLASCIYFDIKEDIKTFDAEYNNKKVAIWKKKDLLAFLYEKVQILTEPYTNLSPQDLAAYLLELNKQVKRQKQLILGQKDLKSKSKKEAEIKT